MGKPIPRDRPASCTAQQDKVIDKSAHGLEGFVCGKVISGFPCLYYATVSPNSVYVIHVRP